MADCVLFDVDGTLVDSVDFHAQAWVDAFGWYGKYVPFQSMRDQIGKGGDLILQSTLSSDEIENFGDELSERRTRHYLDRYMPLVQPFPKVRPLFEALHLKGIDVALATSAQDEELERLREVLQVDDLLATQTNRDEVQRSKPFPDIFSKALDKLGRSPSEAYVVGDSPYDVLAARTLGVDSIALLCGGFQSDQLLKAGAKALYRDPSDLHEGLSFSLLCPRVKRNGARLA